MDRVSWVKWGAIVLLCQQLSACGDDGTGTSTVVTDAQAGRGGSGGTGAGGTTGAGGSGAIAVDASGGSAGSSTQDGSNCGTFGGEADCGTCLRQNCCSATAACSGNPDCVALVECAGQCASPTDGTTPCVRACAGQNEPGISAFNAALVCLGSECDQMCTRL